MVRCVWGSYWWFLLVIMHVIMSSCIMVYGLQSSFGEPWSYDGDQVRVAGSGRNQWCVTYADDNDFSVLWFQEGIWSYSGDHGAKWTWVFMNGITCIMSQLWSELHTCLHMLLIILEVVVWLKRRVCYVKWVWEYVVVDCIINVCLLYVSIS